jgi:hypothetical protein
MELRVPGFFKEYFGHTAFWEVDAQEFLLMRLYCWNKFP